MTKNFVFLLVALGAIVGSTGCGISSHIEVARGVDFNNYKTFAWNTDSGITMSSRANNDIVDDNVKNDISSELEKKGWIETDHNPDVLLDYNVMVEKKLGQHTEPVYSYPYSQYYYNPWRRRGGYFYHPSFLQSYHTYNVPFNEATLTVNMIDAKTNKLIWQGSSQQEVNNKNVTSQEAQVGVKSIFKKLNLPSSK
jgi:hypothetical protein